MAHDVEVDVEFRDGDTETKEAGCFSWRKDNHSKDIVRYRVL